ncbi:MAG: peptidylprolyl isomerase [Bradymonadales bacterium]|jgi:parvulin-like peptidyl-prolyl isomerase
MRKFLIFSAFVLGVGLWSQAAQGEIIERIVAVVGDDIISLQDMRDEGAMIMAMQNDDLKLVDHMDGEYRDAKLTQIAKELVQRRLIEKEARKLSSPVTEREVQQQVEAIYGQNGGNEAEFKEYLSSLGLKFETFRTIIRGELQSQFVMRAQLAGQITVSDADVNVCARELAPGSERGISMELRQILIREDAGDSALGLSGDVATFANAPWWNSIDKVHALVAQGVRDELVKDPAWFLEAVQKFSSGQSAEQEGRLGTFTQSELSKEFSAVFSLEKGGISEVLRTGVGHHIVYVDEVKEGETEAWKKAQVYCRNKIMIQEGERLTKSWLDNMMEKNYVSIKILDDISQKVSD